jgi:soluble cytochrome b562
MFIYVGALVSTVGQKSYSQSKQIASVDAVLLESQRVANLRDNAKVAGTTAVLFGKTSAYLGAAGVALSLNAHPGSQAASKLLGIASAAAAAAAAAAAMEQVEQEKKAEEAQKKADEERRKQAEQRRNEREFRDGVDRLNHGADRTYGGKASALDTGKGHRFDC